MSARGAWRAALACLLALVALGLAWELALAPMQPGGSWLALKVLPLVAALPGLLRARRYTFQWTTMLVWLYAAEGATRAVTDARPAAVLAAAQLALALAYFASAVAFLRATRGRGQPE